MIDDGRCDHGRWTTSRCDGRGLWYNYRLHPAAAVLTWCDEHRHEGDVPTPEGVRENLVGETEERECYSCENEMPRGECPQSALACGHHCNCSWVHDRCCLCGKEFEEEDDQ